MYVTLTTCWRFPLGRWARSDAIVVSVHLGFQGRAATSPLSLGREVRVQRTLGRAVVEQLQCPGRPCLGVSALFPPPGGAFQINPQLASPVQQLSRQVQRGRQDLGTVELEALEAPMIAQTVVHGGRMTCVCCCSFFVADMSRGCQPCGVGFGGLGPCCRMYDGDEIVQRWT